MLTRSDGGWPFDWGFSARVPFFQGGDRCTGGLVHAEARHNSTYTTAAVGSGNTSQRQHFSMDNPVNDQPVALMPRDQLPLA